MISAAPKSSSESLSGTELNNAEIWSRIDLDGDGTIGAQINTLLASGRINDPNPGSGQYRDGTRRFAYDTSQGILLSTRSFNTTSNDPGAGSTLDLRQAGDYYENRYEGPQQILLSNGNNAAYSIPAGETLLAARERIARYDNSGESYTDGFELIFNNANTGTISAVSFDLGGQLIEQSALSSDQVSALEIELIADLNGDGITGAQVVEQLYNKDNNNLPNDNWHQRNIYRTADDNFLLSRETLWADNQIVESGNTADLSGRHNNSAIGMVLNSLFSKIQTVLL